MAETVRTEQLTVLPEYQEKFLKDLLASTQARAGEPTFVPERQVAGLSPGQQQALNLGYSGVGAYAPMLQAGEQTLGSGARGLEMGLGTALSGAPLLMGTTGAYDPRSAQAFMDPYMENVIAQTQADIGRQGRTEPQRHGTASSYWCSITFCRLPASATAGSECISKSDGTSAVRGTIVRPARSRDRGPRI